MIFTNFDGNYVGFILNITDFPLLALQGLMISWCISSACTALSIKKCENSLFVASTDQVYTF